MKAVHNPYSKIIGNAAQFVIPVFQRDYSWTEAQCEQLWRDVIRIANDSTDRGHFLGSVVYISTEDISSSFTRWLLIDGQQRVTTLTLLAAALRDHIYDTRWDGGEDGPTLDQIEGYYLKNDKEKGTKRNKLVLRRHDQDTLHAILEGDDMPNVISERIRDNYDYFREQLKDACPAEVYRGIGRLVVVDVTLDRGVDDPQLIFESLNSTGMDLSQSDLIRNFILMRLPERTQSHLYDTYWSKLESLFRGSERTFDAFARDYLALQTEASKQEKADAIYFAFRREFGTIGSDPDQLESLLETLLRFARFHATFSIGTGAQKQLGEPLARLRRLVDVPAILVMRLFEQLDNDTLTVSQFIEAIEIIESYVFRRAICGEQTRGYWQIFANLAYKIDEAKPLESLKVGLARQHDNYRFPDDTEFRRALEERDVYGKRVCFELLDRLENHGTKEPTDTSSYSIEHIMPQNEKLVAKWRKMLGDDWHEVQRQWLHRLGNLTLTGYNSKYSDRPFDEKKSISGGFQESSVRLNKYVREQSKWTANEMETRGKALAGKALSIWKPLTVDQALIDAAEQKEVRELAKRRDVGKVPMTQTARQLFEALSARISALDASIIELAEKKSVSYHGPSFFMEVLPRKHRLNLLLAVEFNEIDDPTEIAKDTSDRKFFANAQYEGGVNIPIWNADEIDQALPIVRHTYELAKE